MTQIEKYNRFGRLLETYPDFNSACCRNHISPNDMARRLTYWNDSSHEQFKWARAEDCAKVEQFPIIQCRGDQVINRFVTLQEAASVMNYSISQIGRWVQSGETDVWGCTWARIKREKA